MFMVRFPIALGGAKFLKVCLLRNIFAFLNWKNYVWDGNGFDQLGFASREIIHLRTVIKCHFYFVT